VDVAVYEPTAVHVAVVVQETPSSRSPDAPGLGLGVSDQLDPFQLSISVLSVDPVTYRPAPTQLVGVAHETAASGPCAGFDNVHDGPLRVSVRPLRTLEPLTDVPTAAQKLLTHETPSS
jgi:hypothetical protein